MAAATRGAVLGLGGGSLAAGPVLHVVDGVVDVVDDGLLRLVRLLLLRVPLGSWLLRVALLWLLVRLGLLRGIALGLGRLLVRLGLRSLLTSRRRPQGS